MPVSTEQLISIMPLAAKRMDRYSGPLNAAMTEYSITSPEDTAMFLAQLAHESGQFRYMEELANGEAYEGRLDLGNVYPGDGRKFKGRGPIQITGRSNYILCSRDLFGDQRLIETPEILTLPEPGCRSACWFWHRNKLSRFSGDIRECTRRINGGYNGLAERQVFWARAKEILGVEG